VSLKHHTVNNNLRIKHFLKLGQEKEEKMKYILFLCTTTFLLSKKRDKIISMSRIAKRKQTQIILEANDKYFEVWVKTEFRF
jgi:hypothetical protein